MQSLSQSDLFLSDSSDSQGFEDLWNDDDLLTSRKETNLSTLIQKSALRSTLDVDQTNTANLSAVGALTSSEAVGNNNSNDLFPLTADSTPSSKTSVPILNLPGGGVTANSSGPDDTIYVFTGDEFITIVDPAGIDTIDLSGVLSTNGISLLEGDPQGISTNGNTANIQIAVGSIIENLIGSDFDDNVLGNFVNNRIETGDGDDTITESFGNDTIDGGAGNSDLYSATNNIEDYVFGDFGDGTIIIRNTVSGSIDSITNVEEFSFVGNTLTLQEIINAATIVFNDQTEAIGDTTYVFTGDEQNFLIIDQDGIDTFDFRNTTSAPVIFMAEGTAQGISTNGNTSNIAIGPGTVIENVIASDTNNSIVGNDVDNNIQALGGDDFISASLGNDTVDGGLGNDTYFTFEAFADHEFGIIDANTILVRNNVLGYEDTVSNVEIFDFFTESFTLQEIKDVATITFDPEAIDDAITVDEDFGPVDIEVLLNDSHPLGEEINVVSFTAPSQGTVIQNGNVLTYESFANANGIDTFTYTVEDLSGRQSTATVNVTINPINDAPVAGDLAFSVDEDNNLILTQAQLLSAASDVDVGDSLTALNVQSADSNITVTDNGDGTFTLTPADDFNGEIDLTYDVTDGQETVTANIDLTVNPINDAPVAVNDDISLDEDTSLTFNPLANDFDIDSNFSIVSISGAGLGSVVDNGDGTLTYTGNANAFGSDSFTYTIRDDAGAESTATVNVTINPINDAPIVGDLDFSVDEDNTLILTQLDLLENADDVDGDTLTALNVRSIDPNINVIDNGNGTFTLTPANDFNGDITLTYDVTDGEETVTANINLTVNPVNDAPIAQDDNFSGDQDTQITGNLLADNGNGVDSDPDGDALSVQNGTFATLAGGTVIINQDGSFTYTPLEGFSGNDSFDYTLLDGNGGTDTATVNLTINEVFEGIVGTEEDDTLNGTNEDDTILGLGGNDVINALGGNDFIEGGEGHDTIDGGFGNDTIDGGEGNDELYAGRFGTDHLMGGAGNDILRAGLGSDLLEGGLGNDILYASSGSHQLFGDEGDDELYASSGSDHLEGGSGNDFLKGGSGRDTLLGQDGDDEIRGGSGGDFIDGGAGNDILYDGSGSNIVIGGEGNDQIFDSSGNDQLFGGDGNDILVGSSGSDLMDGGDGDDIITAGSGNDTLLGGAGNDTLTASSGRDILNGGEGNDILTGRSFTTLEGGAGDDTINAGRFKNTVIAGEGADTVDIHRFGFLNTIKFENVDEQIDTVNNFTIGGFRKDTLDLSDVIFGYDSTQHTIDDFISFNDSGDLFIDADGGGDNFVHIATLNGSDFTGVTASDLEDSGQLVVNDTALV